MRALTLYPEWSHAVAHLGKNLENRSWPFPRAMIGQRIAIHAGAHVGGRSGRPAMEHGLAVLDVAAFASYMPIVVRHGTKTTPAGVMYVGAPGGHWSDIVTSAVIATAVVWADVDREHRSEHFPDTHFPPWSEQGADHWWRLLDVEVLAKPVPCRGFVGLWTLPDDVAAAVEAQR